MIAGGTSTWATSSAKLCTPSREACSTAIALAGAVVSNPTAKNTTVLSGLRRATSSASSGEYTTRTSPPAARAMNRSSLEPGTRSMSPNEHRIASGFFAIAIASSISASGVTQTGQPGPCTNSTAPSSTWSMPWRISVCVWPPQTSMIVHGRVALALDPLDQVHRDPVVAVLVDVLHAAPPGMCSGRTPSGSCGRSMYSRLSISASSA